MNWIQLLYVNHLKLFFKSYTKIIGFAAGLITLGLNSINLIPSWGYSGDESIREIKPDVFNSINLYLFRLILLSKWRITKFKHPLFTKVSRLNWNKLETALMTFAIWKIMNLNDFLKSSEKLISNQKTKIISKFNGQVGKLHNVKQCYVIFKYTCISAFFKFLYNLQLFLISSCSRNVFFAFQFRQ